MGRNLTETGLCKHLWDDVPGECPSIKVLPKRLRIMHRMYGCGEDGQKCGECASLVGRGRRWKKCTLTNPGYKSTDWLCRWPACGKFEKWEKGL